MARSIVEEIKANEEPEDPSDEFSVTFREFFAEREYEQFMDGYMSFSREELIELRDKITEAL
jgi:hypothetical protein